MSVHLLESVCIYACMCEVMYWCGHVGATSDNVQVLVHTQPSVLHV